MTQQYEQTGIALTAQNATQFVKDIENAHRAIESFGVSVGRSIKAAMDGDFGKIGNALTNLIPATTQAERGIQTIAAATGEAGTAVAALSTGAVVALGAIAAAALAVSAAVGGIAAAVNSAVDFGSQIHDIQQITGLSAEMSQSVYGAAKVSGTSVDTVTRAFTMLNHRVDESGDKAGKSLGAISNASDTAAKRMGRLNEDYAQSVADIQQQLADRIAAINKQREEAETQLSKRLERLNADYAKRVADEREQLAQRLGDIESSHAERVQSINDNIAEVAGNLADKRADIERNLSEKLTELNDRAQQDMLQSQQSGAKEQASLTENLQRELASIEAKYAAQRQSLQEKIVDPSTNPILRAYYKTQVASLDKTQTAEQQAARDTFAAKQTQAKAETQLAIDTINERLAKETAIERTHAAQKLADAQSDADKRTAALTAQLSKEDAEYAKQTTRLKAEYDKRAADAKASLDQQIADARASYAAQITDAAASQAAIEAQTAARLAREKQQLERGVQDTNDTLARATSGASASAAGIDQVSRAFEKLGIDAEAFRKASPDEQFKMLSDAVGAMIAGGHTQEAVNILSDLFGPRMASNLVDFFTEAQHLRELGFTQEQIDNLYNFRKQTNAVGLQLEVLVAQIGTDLLPIAEAMISAFQRFWKEHGPAITTAIRNIAQWLSANLVPAIQSVWQWLSSNLGPAIQSVAQWITGRFVPAVTTAWTWLTGSFIPSVDKAATSVGTAFTQSVTAVSTAFNRDFGPAIQFVKGLIDEQMRVSDSLRTSLGILATQVSGSLSSAFDGAGRAVSGFLSGIRDIYNFVTSTFNGAIANLQSQLAALHPPAIFTPGSPTPFEMGLRGIHDAMRNINREGLPEIGTQSAIDRAMSAGTPLQYAQVLPATPAQMGASSVTNNDSRVAYVTINVDGGDGASVQDGVYGALVRAGFVMVS